MKKLKIDKPEISSNYSRISNNIWIDPNITPSQLKLLGFLLSQKNGFELNIYFISKCFKRDSMRIKSDLNKLIEYGIVIINDNNLSFNKDILDGKITTKCSKNEDKNNDEITTKCSKTEKHDETLDGYRNSNPEITTNCSINNTIAPERSPDSGPDILDILKEKEINKEKEKTKTRAERQAYTIDVQKNEIEKEHQDINASKKNEFEKKQASSFQYPGENIDIPTNEVSLISGTSPDNKNSSTLDSYPEVIKMCSSKLDLYTTIFKSYLKKLDPYYLSISKYKNEYETYIIANMSISNKTNLKEYLEDNFPTLIFDCTDHKKYNKYKLEIIN